MEAVAAARRLPASLLSVAAPAARAPASGLDADLRDQIRAHADLARLFHELGFDLEVADRARMLLASLKQAIRAEVDDVPALQAAVAAARSQAKASDMPFATADRELLDAVAAAGTNRAAILDLLCRDPAGVQLPFVERIPMVRNGAVSWRTPVDHVLIRRRPGDRAAFERRLDELDKLFVSRQGPHREPLRQQVLEALDRTRRDAQRENAYIPTSLQFLDRSVEAYLEAGTSAAAPSRFERLKQLLSRLTVAEQGAAAGDPVDAMTVTALANEFVSAGWLHVPSLTHRMVALLLAPSYVSVSGWYRRQRNQRMLTLLRQEIAEAHYDTGEVVRRLQQLEARGVFFSSLVYPLLRASPPPKAKAVARKR
jgi:hypothetical protein